MSKLIAQSIEIVFMVKWHCKLLCFNFKNTFESCAIINGVLSGARLIINGVLSGARFIKS